MCFHLSKEVSWNREVYSIDSFRSERVFLRWVWRVQIPRFSSYNLLASEVTEMLTSQGNYTRKATRPEFQTMWPKEAQHEQKRQKPPSEAGF